MTSPCRPNLSPTTQAVYTMVSPVDISEAFGTVPPWIFKPYSPGSGLTQYAEKTEFDEGDIVMPEKPTKIELEAILPQTGFAVSCHFNRYCIETDGDIRFIQCAYVLGGRRISTFTWSIARTFIEQSRERLLPYLGKLGLEPGTSEPWTFSEPQDNVREVKMLHCARTDQSAELALYTFTMHMAIGRMKDTDKSKDKKSSPPLNVDPVARLYSKTALHQLLIMELLGRFKDES